MYSGGGRNFKFAIPFVVAIVSFLMFSLYLLPFGEVLKTVPLVALQAVITLIIPFLLTCWIATHEGYLALLVSFSIFLKTIMEITVLGVVIQKDLNGMQVTEVPIVGSVDEAVMRFLLTNFQRCCTGSFQVDDHICSREEAQFPCIIDIDQFNNTDNGFRRCFGTNDNVCFQGAEAFSDDLLTYMQNVALALPISFIIINIIFGVFFSVYAYLYEEEPSP